MSRLAVEIKAGCFCILYDKCIIPLVNASSSPTATFEMIFTETRDIPKLKAGRWLAILRRDHHEEFLKLTESTNSHAVNGKAN